MAAEDGVQFQYLFGQDVLNTNVGKNYRNTPKSSVVQELLFADDAAFYSTSAESLQRKMNVVDEVVKAYGQSRVLVISSLRQRRLMRLKSIF